jgi:hypothetical protein
VPSHGRNRPIGCTTIEHPLDRGRPCWSDRPLALVLPAQVAAGEPAVDGVQAGVQPVHRGVNLVPRRVGHPKAGAQDQPTSARARRTSPLLAGQPAWTVLLAQPRGFLAQHGGARRLVTAGLSNEQIADRLILSRACENRIPPVRAARLIARDSVRGHVRGRA